MKKILLSLLVLLFSIGAFAQDKSAEAESGLVRARLSAGLYSTKDFHTSLQGYSDADAWGKHSAANFFLDLSFYRYKTIEIQLGFGYQSPQPKMPNPNFNGVFEDDNDLDLSYVTIIPQIRFNWIQSDDMLFELYSSLGLGVTIVSLDYAPDQNLPPDETYPLPGFHLNWLGMRFGDDFGGFIEFGFGTKGLMAAGVSYRM